jgi:hypothetical protein
MVQTVHTALPPVTELSLPPSGRTTRIPRAASRRYRTGTSQVCLISFLSQLALSLTSHCTPLCLASQELREFISQRADEGAGADQLAALHAQWAEAQDKLEERKAVNGASPVTHENRQYGSPRPFSREGALGPLRELWRQLGSGTGLGRASGTTESPTSLGRFLLSAPSSASALAAATWCPMPPSATGVSPPAAADAFHTAPVPHLRQHP